MADRIMVIAELGTLATAAAQRGEDRAAESLRDAIKLLVEDAGIAEQLSRRRGNDAKRQTKHRHVTSRDITLQNVTPGFSPRPPFPTPELPTTTTFAREAKAEEVDHIERLTGLLALQMGGQWSDVDAFVKRRPYHTWAGWLREMLALIGPGSQFAPSDLAQVCRDDGALSSPIGTPKGLRGFLSSARVERMTPRSENGAVVRSAARPAAEAQRIVAEIRGMIITTQQPGQAANRIVPMAKVVALGDRVVKAFQQVGGPTRFLSTTGENVSFLIRDFQAALDG